MQARPRGDQASHAAMPTLREGEQVVYAVVKQGRVSAIVATRVCASVIRKSGSVIVRLPSKESK
jgi:hypothetical protein